jgi:Fe-S-cluster containining protein
VNAHDFLAKIDMALVLFSAKQIKDLSMFVHKLRKQSDPVSAFLWQRLPEPDQIVLMSAPSSKPSRRVVVKALNSAIGERCIYEPSRFQGIVLRPKTLHLMEQGPLVPNLARLNRLLLEDAYPLELARTLKTEQAACHRCQACWCCYEPAYADEREVDYMLEALTPAQISEVAETTSRWLDLAKPMLHQEKPNALAWRRLDVPCPFLKNGRCMVYARRPSGCRTFFALNDPDNCKMPARAHQLFTEFAPLQTCAISMPFILAVKEVTMDHLGAFLARKLLRVEVQSGAKKTIHPAEWIAVMNRQAAEAEEAELNWQTQAVFSSHRQQFVFPEQLNAYGFLKNDTPPATESKANAIRSERSLL